MGGFLASLFSIGSAKPTRFLMLGLDAAGKTTVLYTLKVPKLKNLNSQKRQKPLLLGLQPLDSTWKP
jgi:hypothetical protein